MSNAILFARIPFFVQILRSLVSPYNSDTFIGLYLINDPSSLTSGMYMNIFLGPFMPNKFFSFKKFSKEIYVFYHSQFLPDLGGVASLLGVLVFIVEVELRTEEVRALELTGKYDNFPTTFGEPFLRPFLVVPMK